MKRYFPDIAAIAFILCVVGVFFFPFFFPEPTVLVTPDFGRSDSWHFSIPTKFLLWQSIKQNALPLWSANLGGGFPIFAEGQVGALFPLNLILFKLFDFATAYNLALASTVALFSIGTYFFLRVITKSRLGSLLGATSISLSGIVIPQLPHITLLQGLSLMPWILLATTAFPRITGFSILLALQIFAGFPQATFITVLFAGGYILWQKKSIVAFIIAVCLGILLAAIQLVPSYEFMRQSSQPKGFSADIASYFSYPWQHIKTLLDPFALGNPAMGTYPHFASFDGSIFWENSGFIGLVPLMFALIGLARSSPFFLVTCLLSLLLMTGSHSPLYLIYSFWPFNLFRVPSRFIWIFVFSLLTLAAFGVKKTPHVLVFLLILANSFHLWTTWHNYHLLLPAREWLEAPKTLNTLTPNGKLYTIGVESTHNEFFTTKGWSITTPYISLRNTLLPDSNVIWNYPSTHVYAGRFLARSSLLESLLLSQIQSSNHIATISAFGEKLLSLTGTTDLITAWPSQPVTIVKKTPALPRVYLADDPIVATTLTQAVKKLNDASFRLGQSVLVQQPMPDIQKGTGQATIIKATDTTVAIDVKNNSSQKILVTTDTYYPGWKARVDGIETNIFPVNIAQRGIIMPKGNHEAVFTYEPDSLKIGGFISLFSLMGCLLFAVLFRMRPRVLWLSERSFGSHGQRRPHRE